MAQRYESFIKETNGKKKIKDQVIYLCRWNGNEIVEIHSSDSLFKEYNSTNLYDKDYKLYNFSLMGKAFEMLLEDYLDTSSYHQSYMNADFTVDNFTIRRIQ